jgi:hypothetical protein
MMIKLMKKTCTGGRPASNIGDLLQVGLDVETSLFASLYFSSGRRISIWLFVVNFNFIFSIGQRFGKSGKVDPTRPRENMFKS